MGRTASGALAPCCGSDAVDLDAMAGVQDSILLGLSALWAYLTDCMDNNTVVLPNFHILILFPWLGIVTRMYDGQIQILMAALW